RGTSCFGSRNASGSSPTGLPSGPRYCRYSISNLAARVMESGGLGQGAHSSWSGVGRIGAVRHDFLIGICLRGVFWVADGGWCVAARVARVGDGHDGAWLRGGGADRATVGRLRWDGDGGLESCVEGLWVALL